MQFLASREKMLRLLKEITVVFSYLYSPLLISWNTVIISSFQLVNTWLKLEYFHQHNSFFHPHFYCYWFPRWSHTASSHLPLSVMLCTSARQREQGECREVFGLLLLLILPLPPWRPPVWVYSSILLLLSQRRAKEKGEIQPLLTLRVSRLALYKYTEIEAY